MTNRRDRRLCEERVVLFQSRSALFAVKKAKSIGKASQLRYVSGHQLRFAGVLECMEMDESLHVFTDGTRGARRAKRPVNPPLQPTRRPNMSRATRTRR